MLERLLHRSTLCGVLGCALGCTNAESSNKVSDLAADAARPSDASSPAQPVSSHDAASNDMSDVHRPDGSIDAGADAATDIPLPPPATFTTYEWLSSSILDGTSTHWEQGRDIAFDSKGNIVVVGGTSSSDFPTTPGAYDTLYAGAQGPAVGSGGQTDVFVSKLDRNGKLLWSTFLGGPNYDRAYAVEVGADDEVTIAGRAGPGFPTTAGVIQTQFAGDSQPNDIYGQQDAFIARLSADGKTLRWSTYIGDSGPGVIRDIALASDGSVYFAAAGLLAPMAHIPEQVGPQTAVAGASDAYLGKLSADGTALLFGTFIGGNNSAWVGGNPSVRVSSSGEVYFTAYESGSGASCITPSAFQGKNAGGTDLLVARFSKAHALVFCTYYGGSGDEDLETHTLGIDAVGNAVVGGRTRSTNLPTTALTVGPVAPASANGATMNGFVAVISPDGTKLTAATYLGGSGNEEVEGLAVTPDGDIVFGGFTSSTDLAVTPNALDTTRGGNVDGYLGRLTPSLSAYRYLSYFGGSGNDSFRALSINAAGDLAFTGVTASSDYPGRNAFDTTLNSDTGSTGTQGAHYLVLGPR